MEGGVDIESAERCVRSSEGRGDPDCWQRRGRRAVATSGLESIGCLGHRHRALGLSFSACCNSIARAPADPFRVVVACLGAPESDLQSAQDDDHPLPNVPAHGSAEVSRQRPGLGSEAMSSRLCEDRLGHRMPSTSPFHTSSREAGRPTTTPGGTPRTRACAYFDVNRISVGGLCPKPWADYINIARHKANSIDIIRYIIP